MELKGSLHRVLQCLLFHKQATAAEEPVFTLDSIGINEQKNICNFFLLLEQEEPSCRALTVLHRGGLAPRSKG